MSRPQMARSFVGPTTWLLLLYSIPAKPSGKRAAAWRELKKVGAVYLRDGVAALPEKEATLVGFRAIAAKLSKLGATATVARDAKLDPGTAEVIVSKARADRSEEYSEIASEAEQFLTHLRREEEHRNLTILELGELKKDLGKLHAWAERVRMRDYFGVDDADRAERLLGCCDAELARLADETFRRERKTQ